jgi:hypothetical protein
MIRQHGQQQEYFVRQDAVEVDEVELRDHNAGDRGIPSLLQ